VPSSDRPPSVLLRQVRLVPVGAPAPDGPVDLRLHDGVVAAVAPRLRPRPGERVLDAEGRWAVPGLWDAHVHLQQWSRSLERLDVSGTAGPEQVTAVVAGHVQALPDDDRPVLGYGQRSATWSRRPTVAELDAVSRAHPVALVSGDAHSGWLNSRALQALGVEPRTTPLEEAEWFPVLARLGELGAEGQDGAALSSAVEAAAARGVVGVVDMEWERGHEAWPARVAAGVDGLRVRTATYLDGLDGVLRAGLRTGDPLPGSGGLVTMGPLKVIFDGSLNTRTAWCCEPYAGGDGWRGLLNLSADELAVACARATAGGLEVAVHAIGDAAVTSALDAVEHAGATGSLEHVQLVAPSDLPRFAALGLRASVQPAHLLDDRDVTARLWPDRQDRCFALRSLLDAGAELRLGSDAPVAPLDPWLAMAAAVHRSGDARTPWHAEQSLTPAEALAASTDGRRTLSPGAPADVAVLDHDPLAPAPDSATAAARLRGVQVSATLLGGRVTSSRL
jgi:predicted amidohydrolase YtcJ